MGYDQRVTIEKATNGYTVEMRDPKIVAANMKRDAMDYKDPKRGVYQDPQRTYVFTDMAALTKFLTDNLDKALAGSDYSSSFALLTEDDD
jgi:hypothetical protein